MIKKSKKLYKKKEVLVLVLKRIYKYQKNYLTLN